MNQIKLERRLNNKVDDKKISEQIEYIIGRGLNGSRGKGWECNKTRHQPRQENNQWVFSYTLNFKKVKGQRGGEAEYNQWQEINAMILQTGLNTKFGDSPWKVIVATTTDSSLRSGNNQAPAGREVVPTDDPGMGGVISEISEIISKLGGVREVQTTLGVVKTWNDLEIPPELLGRNSDRELSVHPAWKNLYGLGAQIRILLSNIKRAKETEGRVRNHGVLFGHAGCGKTTTLLAMEKMFGVGAVLRLDATSTTKAGLEKLFFTDLPSIPPLVFLEEAEKADPEGLKVWLGALDDRGEIRKVNFRVNQLRDVKIIFNCTVNNKTMFDRLMGSDGSQAGALSSRCVSQLYFPRPTETILRQILQKEIDMYGGEADWITPCIELAGSLNITDPRVVRSFLSGGDRLMDGTYQLDWMAVEQAKGTFK